MKDITWAGTYLLALVGLVVLVIIVKDILHFIFDQSDDDESRDRFD